MRVLILGGSSEASALARALAGDARFTPTLSLAGRTRAPVLPPVPVRIGGFGGVAGLVAWMRDHGTEAVVNATHPFAARMSANAVTACAEAGTLLLRVLRPEWRAQPGDDWRVVGDMAAAAAQLGAAPRRVLLTIGRQDLAPFAAAPQHDYVIRSVDAPPEGALPPRATVISARGPFAEAEECALLRAHAIERPGHQERRRLRYGREANRRARARAAGGDGGASAGGAGRDGGGSRRRPGLAGGRARPPRLS